MPTGRLYFYGDQEEKTVASLKRLIEKEEGYGFLEQSLVLGKANISNRELLSTVLKRSKASGLPLTLMLPGKVTDKLILIDYNACNLIRRYDSDFCQIVQRKLFRHCLYA